MHPVPPPPTNPFTFERSTVVSCAAAKLYEFHRDTRNAQKVSRGTKFLAVEGTFPLSAGDVFTIRFIQAPIPAPVTWQFLVETLSQDRAIVDVALRSPFPYWRHEHLFDPIDATTTRLTDRVTFTPPLGVVGRVGTRLFGRRLMSAMFASRQKATKRLMEAGTE